MAHQHISTIKLHTVPFMLVHAGKYRTEDKLNIQTIQKLNTTQKERKTAKQNYPGSVASYDTRPGWLLTLRRSRPNKGGGGKKELKQQNHLHISGPRKATPGLTVLSLSVYWCRTVYAGCPSCCQPQTAGSKLTEKRTNLTWERRPTFRHDIWHH